MAVRISIVTRRPSIHSFSAARFSMELGVVAGVHVTTMAAIPVARLEDSLNQEQTWREQPRPENPDLDDNINGH